MRVRLNRNLAVDLQGCELAQLLHGNAPHIHGEVLNMMLYGKHSRPQDGGSLPHPPLHLPTFSIIVSARHNIS